MPINAFGHKSMTASEIKEALDTFIQKNPHLANMPVWVNGKHLFQPVKGIQMHRSGRLIVEVHHG